ncbi:hypothetical protein OSB04_002408, partial [Centaurea solstitialis]
MNMVIFFPKIFDPRDKVEYMEDLMKQMYGETRGKSCFEKVKFNLTLLFEEYVSTYFVYVPSTISTMMPPPPVRSENVPVGKVQPRVRTQLKKQKMESGDSLNKKSELELETYLLFQFQLWHLSPLFSTSGRVLDNFRSFITPKIVEALICTQDWLRGPGQPTVVEENIDEIEKFEQELTNMRIRIGSSTFVRDGGDDDSIPTVDLD